MSESTRRTIGRREMLRLVSLGTGVVALAACAPQAPVAPTAAPAAPKPTEAPAAAAKPTAAAAAAAAAPTEASAAAAQPAGGATPLEKVRAALSNQIMNVDPAKPQFVASFQAIILTAGQLYRFDLDKNPQPDLAEKPEVSA